MAIITSAEAATYLQTTFTAGQSSLVATLIPDLQSLVMDYCKNSFLNNNIYVSAGTISFDTNTVTDSASGFVDAYFVAGDYKVRGSKLNNGILTVSAVAAGALTVSETLVTELAGSEITITKVDFPTSIKPAFAQLINYYLTKQGKQVKSESLPGGYSVSYKDGDTMMFELFGQWKKPYQ